VRYVAPPFVPSEALEEECLFVRLDAHKNSIVASIVDREWTKLD
jgi:hypothetical protein